MKKNLSYDEMEEISKKMEEHHAYTAPISVPVKERFPKPLIIIGAGGFGREVVDIIQKIEVVSRGIELIGFLDENRDLHHTKINNIEVLGDIGSFSNDLEIYFTVAIGDPEIKQKMVKKALKYKFIPITLIHPNAHLCMPNYILKGSIIQAGCCIAVDSLIEQYVHVNFNCTIGHDVKIGKYTTISPHCAIMGETEVGKRCFFGTGAIIYPRVKIGDNSKIGAGSIVTKDIPPNVLAIGNPARIVKRLDI